MTMRKSVLRSVIAASVAMGIGAPLTAQTSILYANYSAPTATLNAHGIIPFLELAEELSEGTLSTQFVGGGSVVTTRTTLFAMRDGLVDGVFLGSLYFPSELPVNNLFVDMGSAVDNAMATSGALAETFLFNCPECLQELSDWNVHFLGSWSTTPYDLICSRPIQTLADFQGLRIRASGHTVSITDALGAVATSLTVTEIYEALQRNQVDCSFGVPGWLESYSLGDSAKYLLDLNAGAVMNPVLLSLRRDLWEELTEQQRRALVGAAPLGMAGAVFGYIEEDAAALARTDRGYTVLEPEQVVLDAIAQQASLDVQRAVDTAVSRGVANAQEIAENFLETYARWVQLVDGVNTQDEYSQVLQREIFDRYPLD